jgi:hypothetical protein
MMDPRSAFVVCSSVSVARWWPAFTSATICGSMTWPAGDAGRSLTDVLATIDRTAEDAVIFVLSEHETLARDAALVAALRAQGRTVIGTGHDEARFELDKISAKRLFVECGIPTPTWYEGPPSGAHDRLLYKSASSTAGHGIHWHDDASRPARNGYYEEFVRGDEYSLVLLVSEKGMYFLPPVWKGATNVGLVPPYKRLRMCGMGVVEAQTHVAMIVEALKLAGRCFALPCIAEIEFVLDEDRGLKVLEVNPRIAGTTRMSSLAAGRPFLDLCIGLGHQSVIHASRLVAEFPVTRDGDRACLGPDMFATSRLTIAGSSIDDLRRLLERALDAGWEVDEAARLQFERRMLHTGTVTLSSAA